jgi:hypothetical protein
MNTPRKWNGDNRPFLKKGPIPKGDPRDKINAHNRAESKREIRQELRKLEIEKLNEKVWYEITELLS